MSDKTKVRDRDGIGMAWRATKGEMWRETRGREKKEGVQWLVEWGKWLRKKDSREKQDCQYEHECGAAVRCMERGVGVWVCVCVYLLVRENGR